MNEMMPLITVFYFNLRWWLEGWASFVWSNVQARNSQSYHQNQSSQSYINSHVSDIREAHFHLCKSKTFWGDNEATKPHRDTPPTRVSLSGSLTTTPPGISSIPHPTLCSFLRARPSFLPPTSTLTDPSSPDPNLKAPPFWMTSY